MFVHDQEKLITLIVEAPNRAGRGHEFLVATMDEVNFKQELWTSGKSDELIITLESMRKNGFGHYRAKTGIKRFTCDFERKYVVKHPIKKIKINFKLPTPKEVDEAIVRHNHTVTLNEISVAEKEIEGRKKFILSSKKCIADHLARIRQPNILLGECLHVKTIALRDLRKDIRDVRAELKRSEKHLIFLRAELAEMETTNNADPSAAPPA